ncbi:MAG: antibiotic biosynthesis monooxygenase [Rhizobiales bacterium]|nr:antibiotic biosynthesis monooxygenase [Hyphomicrobiales bacterium]MBO6699932.1 antibiotic biosynthesis monooxygenase [Hyphomicrobiales bacterium]MBO6737902.1 antibiotic biosynthesis monooxygenase [Hyphomicrobiales bacterium]MBO6913040.1 antibiotic biosynthesis monooxygenase [Hyphomicrobiales bacterium]MBO6956629.1 antibiotic biosynthesis monooxygenase [Hyphomicrobiales bacterium]
MYVVTVRFQIKPEHREAFSALMRAQARNSLALEPACRRFDVCELENDRNAIFLYEIYDNRAAFDLHLESGHFRRFDEAVADMVATKSVETMLLTQG